MEKNQIIQPHIHPEAKSVEQPNIHHWMAQASGDAPKGFAPMVIWKKNQHEPLVIFQLDVLERLVEEEGFLKWSEEIKMNNE